ncbi:hypothetical protein V9T40_014513 [Parthenolecanium corni]|uniref:Uncharacterized protein n=1 Tax=Parthenolecanium corni TaxID=536013 RepID=A0AAN9T403_9HEMI
MQFLLTLEIPGFTRLLKGPVGVINDTTRETSKDQMASYDTSQGSNQFQCVSGHCIDQKLTCNGKRDCDDGTDETIKQCENHKCSKNQFRCGYGACIDLKLKCDGVKHCPDGSDEFSELCKVISETPAPKPTPTPVTESSTPGSCTLPQVSPDKKFTVQCPDNIKCNNRPGKKVPKYTEVSFRCNPGYQHDDPEPFVSICSNGVWLPPIANCNKICKTLKPKNVDLVCYRKGTDVDCEGTLVAGTTVRPRCKPQHHEEYPVYYRDITCQADGEWTNPLFSCAPECGKPYANVTKLIAYGTPEKYGDSPWHVAIYDISEKDKPLICGGTIVSPQLIISAAHCFFDEYNQTPQKIGRYELAVSKVSRHYTTKDNGLTKFYKIREIFYSTKGYTGTSTNYASDIVIIWVAEKISLSRGVLPACIRWTDNGAFNPGESTPGKLVGWGLDEKGNPSEVLLSANLPYISYAKCVETANPDFRGSITLDKFCAGSKTGAGARQGDSGGGLLYRDANTGLYYLQGVVSIKDPTETSIAAFTDVAQYIDWINEIKKQCIDKGLICDGIPHCYDHSDETTKLCSSIGCPSFMYRCHYGACVGVSSICDGVPDCIDGSDEPPYNNCHLPPSYFQTLPLISTPPSTSKTEKPKTTTKRYTPFEPSGWTQPATITPVPTRATPAKTPVTPVHTPATLRQTISTSVSTPPTSAVTPSSGQCQLPGQTAERTYAINECTSNSTERVCLSKDGEFVDSGTVLYFKCEHKKFTYENDIFTAYCLDGGWLPPIESCKSCGILPPGKTDGNMPWQAAIYEKSLDRPVCWGSVISPYVLISAAHCFFDNALNWKKDINTFYATVGKFDGKAPEKAQLFNITNVKFSQDGFQGTVTNYASDVAVVEISPTLQFNAERNQVCLETTDPLTNEKNIGRLSLYKPIDKNSILDIETAPYLEYADCVNIVSDSFKELVTSDKICILNKAIEKGNAGKGFYTQRNGESVQRLRGVISTTFVDTSTNRQVLTITDLTKHLSWINEMTDEINQNRRTSEDTSLSETECQNKLNYIGLYYRRNVFSGSHPFADLIQT